MAVNVTVSRQATSGVSVLSVDNHAFRIYIFYSALLALKFLLMVFLVAYQRFKKRVILSPEDASMGKLIGKRLTVTDSDPDVERVRRCHQNDLESIIIFLLTGLAYLFTGPAARTVSILFGLFFACRCLHTLVYAIFIFPQPTRLIVFLVGLAINMYLAFAVVTHLGLKTI